jgi:sulfoxide reductase heme-binding subunit YedZ
VTFSQLAPYLPWLASRSAGIVAFGLVSASVILGLSMSTKVTTQHTRTRLRGVHEQLAVAGLIAIAAHGLLLLGDGWLHASPVNLVVPFTLGYRSLFTGLGVLAGWGGALFGLSYYARRRIGGTARWRKLHRASVLVWLLGGIHALGAGSDASTIFLRVLVIGSAIPIGGLLALRLSGGATTPTTKAPPAVPPAAPVAPQRMAPEPLWSRPPN